SISNLTGGEDIVEGRMLNDKQPSPDCCGSCRDSPARPGRPSCTTTLVEWSRSTSSPCPHHHEGAVRVHCAGTSPSRGAAFPCDGASLCSLDDPAERRGLCRSESAPLSPPRSRPHQSLDAHDLGFGRLPSLGQFRGGPAGFGSGQVNLCATPTGLWVVE